MKYCIALSAGLKSLRQRFLVTNDRIKIKKRTESFPLRRESVTKILKKIIWCWKNFMKFCKAARLKKRIKGLKKFHL